MSPEILFNKGQIMVYFGKYEEAIEFYEKALQFQRQPDKRNDIEQCMEKMKSMILEREIF